MIVCRKSVPWAFHVSAFLLTAVGALTYAIVQGMRQQPSAGLAVLAVVDLLLVVLVVTLFKWLTIEGPFLKVRRVFSSDSLERSKAAFGVRPETNDESIHYIVFVTDGFRHVDVGSYGSDAGARRGVRRLTEALLDGGPLPGSAGLLEAERIEAHQRMLIERTQAMVAEYTAATWRRTRIVVIVVVATASFAAALLSWWYAQFRR